MISGGGGTYGPNNEHLIVYEAVFLQESIFHSLDASEEEG
jgi:hypothetical protein